MKILVLIISGLFVVFSSLYSFSSHQETSENPFKEGQTVITENLTKTTILAIMPNEGNLEIPLSEFIGTSAVPLIQVYWEKEPDFWVPLSDAYFWQNHNSWFFADNMLQISVYPGDRIVAVGIR